MNCARDLHRHRAGYDTSTTSRWKACWERRPHASARRGESVRWNSTDHVGLWRPNTVGSTYQAGADSSNKLMGSSAKRIDSTALLPLCDCTSQRQHCALLKMRWDSFSSTRITFLLFFIRPKKKKWHYSSLLHNVVLSNKKKRLPILILYTAILTSSQEKKEIIQIYVWK